jgi:hypothetical protein
MYVWSLIFGGPLVRGKLKACEQSTDMPPLRSLDVDAFDPPKACERSTDIDPLTKPRQ